MAEIKVRSELAATVWKIETSVGMQVNVDDTLLILESMKMEIPVTAPSAGTVSQILTKEGSSVAEDDVLVVIKS